MRKNIIRIICTLVALASLTATCTLAAPAPAGPTIRVNGSVVSFPDGQPYIDSADRTMVPVRFVTEALGAAVGWDGATRTATIAKGGTTVSVAIGSPELTVVKGGKTSTVRMDTVAVLRSDRTYVPLRFIAEALDAAVDYSEVYDTVGVYADVLTAGQIARLRALPYTQPQYAIGYESYKSRHSAADTLYFYGSDRDSFSNFANAREHLYHECSWAATYYCDRLGKTLHNDTPDTVFRAVTDEARAEVEYESERLTVRFLTDGSCIYQSDSINLLTCTVRGIAEVTLHAAPTELTGYEAAFLCRLGFTQVYRDTVMYSDIDVHMSIRASANVNIHTIVPLGDTY